MEGKDGRYSRGYLPHINVQGRAQFLTWRLADAVPTEALEAWRAELASLPDKERSREIAKRIERFADAGHGACVLRNPLCAREVQHALFADHERQYDLLAWVVMPNHVHVLLNPNAPLRNILQRVKGATAYHINRRLGRTGSLWQADYFDRLVRDDEHLERVRRYIEWNPVKAGLCQDPTLYPWSSANPSARDLLGLKSERHAG